MNTTQLECFLSLAKTLNYVKTAEQLNLTQPAVSKQIKSLETELGVRLFDRTTRSVTLTQVGQQFLSDASNMISTYYRSKEWISNMNHHSRVSLKIGYSDPHCINIISKILEELLSHFSNLTPNLVYDQTDANLSQLSLGQIDMVMGMKDAHFSDDNIIFQPLHKDSFICVVRKDHPIIKKLSKDKDEMFEVDSQTLYDYRQIISIPPYLMKNYFSRGHKIVPVNENLDNTICINTNEAYGLTLSGFGYSLIPEHLIMNHPDLEFIKWTDSPSADFGIYYKKSEKNNKYSSLMEYIKISKNIYK